jgi:Rod binding domain-containing protein
MNLDLIQAAAPTLGASKDLKALKKATQEFEAVFAKKLLSEMRKGLKETSFGDTLGKDMYEDMMDDTMSKTMAEQGSLGIGKILYKDFAPKVVAIHQMQASREERKK